MGDSADRSWHQPPDEPGGNWPVLLGVGLVLAVVTALVVTLVLGGDEAAAPSGDEEVALPTLAPSDPVDDDATKQPTTTPTVTPTDGATASDAATVDPALLEELTFQRLAGVRLPVHLTAGPTVQGDGLASGFERSPLGAVVAAFNISGRTSAYTGPAVFRPTIERQLTGEAADVEDFLARTERSYESKRLEEGVEDGQPLNEPLFQYLGWSLDYYDGDAAEVRLLGQGRGGDGSVIEATYRTPLRWEDGDWRYVAPPGGNLNPWVATTFEEERFTMFDEVG